MNLPRHHRMRTALYRLEGSVCRACGARAFPPRGVCAACRSTDHEPAPFSGRGRLYSFTRVVQPPRGFAATAPYAVGMVRLEEGPLVTAQLADTDGVDLCIDMEMEMVTRRIRDYSENGLVVYGYKFRPALRPAPSGGGER
jgi:scaffold protein (connect acetoacetyl-CoA thiolase and HMG-CoA synthase)